MMTSKERVQITLENKEPDRVPINFVGANGDIDRRLKEYFGLNQDDNEGLLKALDVDFRLIGPSYIGKRLHEEIEGRQVDPLWGIRTRKVEHESGCYWDFCDFPLKDADMEMAENWPMPSADDFDYSEVVRQCAEHEGYYLVYGNPSVGDIINSLGTLRTMEQTLIDLITDDGAGLKLISRRIDTQAKILRRVLEVANGKIDMLWMGEDLGTQHGPMISLDIFRKHIRPNHEKLINTAKEFGVKVMVHSCGSSSWAFEDFIEMGVDVVDTLQPEAANMSAEYLKKTFGGRLCFNGCISTAGPMAYGTVSETAEDVKQVLDVMKLGGGYVMSPTHMIQDNSPVENVVEAYRVAAEYGKY